MQEIVVKRLRKVLVTGLAVCTILIGCKDAPKETEVQEDHMVIEVKYSSGDDYAYQAGRETLYYAPYPFNVGYAHVDSIDQELMILSRKAKHGDDLKVQPIARLQVEDGERHQQEIYIAIPIEDKWKLLEIKDFSDLTVQHFTLKQIIEFWYSNRGGLDGTSVKGWYPASLDDFRS